MSCLARRLSGHEGYGKEQNAVKIAILHCGYEPWPNEHRFLSDSFTEEIAAGYIERNVDKNIRMLAEAGESGADLAVTNEDFGAIGSFLWDTARPGRFAELVRKTEPAIAARVADVSKKYGMMIAANEYCESDGAIYNMTKLYGRDGALIGTQKKIHIPALEGMVIRGGGEPSVFETDIGVIGVAICYDINFPEVFRALALKGADLILYQTMGWGLGGKCEPAVGEAMVRTRAVENSVYFVVAKSIGDGMSCVIDNYGNFIAKAAGLEERVLYADFTPDYMMEDEYNYDNFFAGVTSTRARLMSVRVPKAYGVLTDDKPPVTDKFKGVKLAAPEETRERIRRRDAMDKSELSLYSWGRSE